MSFPNSADLPSPEDPFTVGLVAHEAMHLKQGIFVAPTAYGELEAWQTGISVTEALGGTYGPAGARISGLPLAHNPIVLTAAVLLMEEQQNGPRLVGRNYGLGWLLLFTTGL